MLHQQFTKTKSFRFISMVKVTCVQQCFYVLVNTVFIAFKANTRNKFELPELRVNKISYMTHFCVTL